MANIYIKFSFLLSNFFPINNINFPINDINFCFCFFSSLFSFSFSLDGFFYTHHQINDFFHMLVSLLKTGQFRYISRFHAGFNCMVIIKSCFVIINVRVMIEYTVPCSRHTLSRPLLVILNIIIAKYKLFNRMLHRYTQSSAFKLLLLLL
jgi:hypothetical protein